MARAKIIVNPYAGRWKGQRSIPAVEAALKEVGVDFSLVCTARPDHAIQIKNSQEQARAMAALTQYLPEGEAKITFQRAFNLVDSFESHADCAEFLTNLAPKMPPEQQSAVWARALQAAQLIEKTPIRMMALVRLGLNLPSGLQETAWECIAESVRVGQDS